MGECNSSCCCMDPELVQRSMNANMCMLMAKSI